jgi:hypothetical protein
VFERFGMINWRRTGESLGGRAWREVNQRPLKIALSKFKRKRDIRSRGWPVKRRGQPCELKTAAAG